MLIPRLHRSSRTALFCSGLFMLVLSQSGVLADTDVLASQCDNRAIGSHDIHQLAGGGHAKPVKHHVIIKTIN